MVEKRITLGNIDAFPLASHKIILLHGVQIHQPRMQLARIQPDLVSYICLLDAVHDKASGAFYFEQALTANVFPNLRKVTPSVIDLHGLSEGAGQLAVRWWLATLVTPQLGRRAHKCTLITGYGKSRKEWRTTNVQAAVFRILVAEWHLFVGFGCFPVGSLHANLKSNVRFPKSWKY